MKKKKTDSIFEHKMMNSRVAFIMTEIEYFIIHLAFRANAGKICKK